MSEPQNLKELYVEELQDLWSANDQMKKVVGQMAAEISEDKLTGMFEKSAGGIQKHTDMLKGLLEKCDDAEVEKEHCKGMEGLVKEARKHAIEADVNDEVRAVAAIAQYQRMCHYGIAGFGTAKAFAEALERSDDVTELDEALEDIYQADDFATELAERSANLKAKEES